MGDHPSISATDWPKQSDLLGAGVKVAFHLDFRPVKQVDGVIVRDDLDDPWRTVIRLYDGRHVLGDECEWRPA